MCGIDSSSQIKETKHPPNTNGRCSLKFPIPQRSRERRLKKSFDQGRRRKKRLEGRRGQGKDDMVSVELGELEGKGGWRGNRGGGWESEERIDIEIDDARLSN